MILKHIDHLFQSNRYSLDCCLCKSLDWFFDEIEDLERRRILNPWMCIIWSLTPFGKPWKR